MLQQRWWLLVLPLMVGCNRDARAILTIDEVSKLDYLFFDGQALAPTEESTGRVRETYQVEGYSFSTHGDFRDQYWTTFQPRSDERNTLNYASEVYPISANSGWRNRGKVVSKCFWVAPNAPLVLNWEPVFTLGPVRLDDDEDGRGDRTLPARNVNAIDANPIKISSDLRHPNVRTRPEVRLDDKWTSSEEAFKNDYRFRFPVVVEVRQWQAIDYDLDGDGTASPAERREIEDRLRRKECVPFVSSGETRVVHRERCASKACYERVLFGRDVVIAPDPLYVEMNEAGWPGGPLALTVASDVSDPTAHAGLFDAPLGVSIDEMPDRPQEDRRVHPAFLAADNRPFRRIVMVRNGRAEFQVNPRHENFSNDLEIKRFALSVEPNNDNGAFIPFELEFLAPNRFNVVKRVLCRSEESEGPPLAGPEVTPDTCERLALRAPSRLTRELNSESNDAPRFSMPWRFSTHPDAGDDEVDLADFEGREVEVWFWVGPTPEALAAKSASTPNPCAKRATATVTRSAGPLELDVPVRNSSDELRRLRDYTLFGARFAQPDAVVWPHSGLPCARLLVNPDQPEFGLGPSPVTIFFGEQDEGEGEVEIVVPETPELDIDRPVSTDSPGTRIFRVDNPTRTTPMRVTRAHASGPVRIFTLSGTPVNEESAPLPPTGPGLSTKLEVLRTDECAASFEAEVLVDMECCQDFVDGVCVEGGHWQACGQRRIEVSGTQGEGCEWQALDLTVDQFIEQRPELNRALRDSLDLRLDFAPAQ